MNVKEVLLLAAGNLGRDDLVSQIPTLSSPSGEAASLLRCYNLIENELAADYFPLRFCESIMPNQGEIAYSALTKNCAQVTAVRRNGAECGFREEAAGIVLDRVCDAVEVEYFYIPEAKLLSGKAEVSAKVTARLMSLGIASEFCLSRGQFSEAALWERKYQDAIRAAHCDRRKKRMRSRRWI